MHRLACFAVVQGRGTKGAYFFTGRRRMATEPESKRQKLLGEGRGQQGLAGKVALVTGATSGIGKQAAFSLASAGCKVIMTARNRTTLETLQKDMKEKGFEVEQVAGDVSIESDVKKVISYCEQVFDHRLDILVNSAGIMQTGSIDAIGVENFDANMNVNARGVFLYLAASAQLLKASKGCVINVSSIAGDSSFSNCLSYCASKAAVDSMTKCAALDLAQHGVRVNAVNPGLVKTELHSRAGVGEEQYEALLKRSIEVTHPLSQSLGRLGMPDDIASAILFLADSSQSAFITGATLRIDGGRGILGAR